MPIPQASPHGRAFVNANHVAKAETLNVLLTDLVDKVSCLFLLVLGAVWGVQSECAEEKMEEQEQERQEEKHEEDEVEVMDKGLP